MDSSFTPGPWTANVEAELTIDGEHGPIATLWTADDFPCLDEDRYEAVNAEQTANAHLIAAAPEMFQALTLARIWVDCTIGLMGELKHPDEQARLTLADIDAALAKAEGRNG